MPSLVAGSGITLTPNVGAGTLVVSANDLVSSYGLIGNGTTNDTPAIAAALAALGTAGGTVVIPDGLTPLIDTNLNIPDNCALVTEHNFVGRTISAPNLNLFKPRLILNRSATITLNNSSELSVSIFAKNLTFSDTSTNVNAWTGTAITLADNTADQYVHDCLIIGFATAISTGANTRVDRPRIHRVQIDCVNGIYIKNAFDIPYITECEGYPWSTLGSTPETNSAHLKRAGAFIQLDGTTNDQAKITDCFDYGHTTGFRMTGADSFTLLNCGADNPPGASDSSIGFLIEGTSFEGRLIGCQASGRVTGFRIDTTDTNGTVSMIGCNGWTCLTDIIRVVHGDVTVIGGKLRNTGGTGNGIYMENTGTKVRAIGVKFVGLAIGIKTDAVGAVVVHDLCDFSGCTTTVNNPYIASIASASPLVLDGFNTFFDVQGTTNFITINDAKVYAGKSVTLKLNAAIVLGTGGNLKLAGAASFSATADDTITFRSNGTNWYETARSVN